MAASSPAPQSPIPMPSPTEFMNQKHVCERSQVCNDFLKKNKRQIVLQYPNSKVQLHSTLISRKQYFELNLAAELFYIEKQTPYLLCWMMPF